MEVVMNITKLMESEYEDLPIEVRQEILGAATYYLDTVVRTGTLPGIEDTIVADMGVWCYYSEDCTIKACLAGIWYMGTTGTILDTSLLSAANINVLGYLDMVASTEDTEFLHELVGLEGYDTCSDEGWAMDDVQERMHSLMRVIPTMEKAYRDASGTSAPIVEGGPNED